MANKYAIVLEIEDVEKDLNEIDVVLELVRNGTYDFIQFVVKPDTYANFHGIVKKKFQGIQSVIHAPFFMHGINLSDPELLNSNLQKLSDAQKFADDLKSDVIVLHPGVGNSESHLNETIRQIKILNDSRIAVENLPYHPRPKQKNVGSTPEQIEKIIKEVGCNFCFDLSHAICTANSLELDIYNTLKKFNKLNPVIYHLSDGDRSATLDYHLHLGCGNYDLTKVFDCFRDSRIVLETRRKEGDLENCIKDVQFAKDLEKNERDNC